MFDFSPTGLAELLLRVPVILLALTFHEWGHAWSAWRLGDPTAYYMGRVSLNPLRHLDPIGTLCLLFAPIGWAKPVPVNPLNFGRPGRDDILVSAAGVATNLIQAAVFALLLRLPWEAWAMSTGPSPTTASMAAWVLEANGPQKLVLAIWVMLSFGVLLNVGLAVFNLLPFFPLDGHHIARENLRGELRARFIELQPMGPAFIIGLIVLNNVLTQKGLPGPISWPILKVVSFLLTHLAGGLDRLAF